MYEGNDAPARLEQITSFDYPNFEVVEVRQRGAWSEAIRSIPAHSDVCVFWVDDDKPIGKAYPDFLTAQPNLCTESWLWGAPVKQ